jgi:hypothetical protein
MFCTPSFKVEKILSFTFLVALVVFARSLDLMVCVVVPVGFTGEIFFFEDVSIIIVASSLALEALGRRPLPVLRKRD